MTKPRATSVLRRVQRTVALITMATVAFYLVPLPGSHSTVLNVIWACAVVGGAVVFIVRQVRDRSTELRAGGDRTTVGLETLANVLFLVALLFAASYFALAHHPGQMSGISSHTDALYFSMTVLSTVGFGDIHASGSFARVVVTVQMLFDLVFVATAVGLVVGTVTARAQATAAERRQAAQSEG